MVQRRVLVPAVEWKDTTAAIRKYLPAGFDPQEFVHQTSGDMLLVWDDEKPYVPPVAPPAAAPPPAPPEPMLEPLAPEPPKPIETNLSLPPEEPPAPSSPAPTVITPRSKNKSKKK